jgi:hypothetical protein
MRGVAHTGDPPQMGHREADAVRSDRLKEVPGHHMFREDEQEWYAGKKGHNPHLFKKFPPA